MELDEDYFRRRAEEECLLGLKATDWRARQAHLELAERYRNIAASTANDANAIGLSARG